MSLSPGGLQLKDKMMLKIMDYSDDGEGIFKTDSNDFG